MRTISSHVPRTFGACEGAINLNAMMRSNDLTTPSVRCERSGSLLFGVRVDRVSTPAALGIVRAFFAKNVYQAPRKVYFANVHTIHLSKRMPDFCRVVNSADLVLPDGSGLLLAGRVLAVQIPENINGTDFTPIVLKEAVAEGWRVYLLGASPNVVKATKARLEESYPGLSIAGYRSGYFTKDEEETIINGINATSPDILLVALGSPLQEMIIDRWAARLNVKVCFAVGGLFDFLSGTIPRAPRWMRRLGIEWLFRLVQDPKSKWERTFIEMPIFVGMLLRARIFRENGFESYASRENN